MNTGYKQATIAYKVSKPGGEPLDINGELCAVSGRKQAIALLLGRDNPNPTKYEVETYYNAKGVISGNPTIVRNTVSCPVGFIKVTPNRLVFDPETPTIKITLISSSSWRLISAPNIATLDYASGAAGRDEINISRTGNVGQGNFIFRNEATLETVAVYVINVISKPWVLESGSWNMLGFWYNNGIWKYNP